MFVSQDALYRSLLRSIAVFLNSSEPVRGNTSSDATLPAPVDRVLSNVSATTTKMAVLECALLDCGAGRCVWENLKAYCDCSGAGARGTNCELDDATDADNATSAQCALVEGLECSGNGVCVGGVCNCNQGFGGKLCSFSLGNIQARDELRSAVLGQISAFVATVSSFATVTCVLPAKVALVIVQASLDVAVADTVFASVASTIATVTVSSSDTLTSSKWLL